MRSKNTEGITDRKLALDFEEVAGRSTPPDRSAEILLRARELEAGDLTYAVMPDGPRGARILPAAFLLLGLAATLGIGILSSEPDPVFSPGAQDKSKKQSAVDEKAKNQERLETEVVLLRTQLREMRAKEEAARKARLQAAARNPIDRMTGINRSIIIDEYLKLVAVEPLKQGLAQSARTTLQGLVLTNRSRSVAGINPLVRGEYSRLLNQFSQAKTKLERTTDPARARKVIDEISIILTNARRVLWEEEQAAKKAGKGGKTDAAGSKGEKIEKVKHPFDSSGSK